MSTITTYKDLRISMCNWNQGGREELCVEELQMDDQIVCGVTENMALSRVDCKSKMHKRIR